MTDPRISPLGLYIHLPFCRSRCGYCDFTVVTDRDNMQSAYVETLQRELCFWAKRTTRPLATLYLGGGTPSQLSLPLWRELIQTIRAAFTLAPDVEVTAEGNPESLQPELLKAWKDLGINRVSMGVQSFQDSFLAMLDRRHNRREALDAVQRIRETGLENWSIDLIYGLPNQTLADWESDLKAALTLSPPHISFYNLILHPNLPTTHKALASLPSDHEEIQSAMFLSAVEIFERTGYEVYELSIAAKPGQLCRHNLRYWTGGDWIGAGMSGAGRIEGEYLENSSSWEAYFESWRTEPMDLPLTVRRPTRDEALLDFIMLGLRLAEGISLRDLEGRVGHPLAESFWRLWDDLRQHGLARETPERLALTPKGWLVHSEIVTRVMNVLSADPAAWSPSTI